MAEDALALERLEEPPSTRAQDDDQGGRQDGAVAQESSEVRALAGVAGRLRDQDDPHERVHEQEGTGDDERHSR